MIKFKKGQAAMEFLMTYGWAILAAIIVVGVLWYLIGNPSNLAGDRFQLSSPIVAEGAIITGGAGTSSIEIEIRNGAGESIIISDISIAGCGGGAPSGGAATLAQGVRDQYTVSCGANTLVVDDRFNGDVTITYTTTSTTLDQISSGPLSGKVRA